MRLFGKKCRTLRQVWLETGESIEIVLFTHKYLLFLFYHQFFDFIYYHFRFLTVDSWFIQSLNSVRGEIIWDTESNIEEDTVRNRVITCKTLTITHNYLIFLFYHHFVVHFLIISNVRRVDIWFIQGFVY